MTDLVEGVTVFLAGSIKRKVRDNFGGSANGLQLRLQRCELRLSI